MTDTVQEFYSLAGRSYDELMSGCSHSYSRADHVRAIIPHHYSLHEIEKSHCPWCCVEWKPDWRGGCSACGGPPA